jgi:serine/threonine protein kinase
MDTQPTSLVYYHEKIIKTDEKINGDYFFKKIFHFSDPPKKYEISMSIIEMNIAKIIRQNPHPNIVSFYEIGDTHITIELVDTNIEWFPKIKDTMYEVKNFLQHLGIIYIDWKLDNIGITKNGIYKLFDFDVSGIIDTQTGKWIIPPLEFYSYKMATKNGYTTPIEIDNYAFNVGFLEN